MLGLALAESLQLRWRQLLVNLYKNIKLIFMTLSPSTYPTSMLYKYKTLMLDLSCLSVEGKGAEGGFASYWVVH